MINNSKAQRPFAVFDIDGTLIRWQLFHAVTDALARLGYLDKKTYETIRLARRDWKVRTSPKAFQTYESAMIRGFEQIIKNITVKEFESAIDSVIEEYKDQIYTYSRQLLAELKSKNYLLFAISGSQHELVSRIAAYYGFDDFVGTDYIKQRGLFTGDKNFYAHDKKNALEQLIDKHQAVLKNSVGIGDSASDISMLELTEKPIAFNPEEALLQHAKEAGWPIVLERKNVIYRLSLRGDTYVLE